MCSRYSELARKYYEILISRDIRDNSHLTVKNAFHYILSLMLNGNSFQQDQCK